MATRTRKSPDAIIPGSVSQTTHSPRPVYGTNRGRSASSGAAITSPSATASPSPQVLSAGTHSAAAFPVMRPQSSSIVGTRSGVSGPSPTPLQSPARAETQSHTIGMQTEWGGRSGILDTGGQLHSGQTGTSEYMKYCAMNKKRQCP